MKNTIKRLVFLCLFLPGVAAYSQLSFDDNVIDNELPVDGYVWVGLIAGILIGVTAAYFLKKKQPAA